MYSLGVFSMGGYALGIYILGATLWGSESRAADFESGHALTWGSTL